MRRGLAWRAFLAVSSLLIAAPLAAETPQPKIERLFESSGLVEQLGQLAPTMQLQFQQARAQGALDLPEEFLARLSSAVDKAFAADKVREIARARLESSLEEADVDAVLKWLSSPLGMRITELEEKSSAPEATIEMQEIGTVLASELTAERRNLYEALDEAIRATDAAVVFMTRSVIAIMEGAAIAAGPESRLGGALDQMKAQAEASRDQFAEMLAPQVIGSFAYIYRDLSDKEVRRYIKFAKTAAARAYHDATLDAVTHVFSRAGQELGALIAPERDAA